MSKNCKDYIQTLCDYIDGELDAKLCADLEEHIGECHNCRLMFDSLKKTVQICRESGGCEELPEELAGRINKAIKARWEKKFGRKQ